MSDPIFSSTEQVKLNNAIDEGVQSLMRQKNIEKKEKNHRADIYEQLAKKEGVPIDKSRFTKLINQRFEGKSSDLIELHEEIVQWDEILSQSNGKSVDDVASSE